MNSAKPTAGKSMIIGTRLAKLIIVSKAIVAIQYGTILQPITLRAYLSFDSLSSTGYPAIVAAEIHIPNESSNVMMNEDTAKNSFCPYSLY